MASVNNDSSSKVAYSYLQFKNKIGGLVSGMDIDSIMEKLMKAESAQMEKLQQQKQKYEWKRDAYREVNTSLSSFEQGLFDNYGKQSNWNAKTVNTSNTTAISVVASSTASGNLSITGSQQAKSANKLFETTSTIQQVKINENTKLNTISGIGDKLELFGQEISTASDSDKTIKDVLNTLNDKGYTAKITDGKLSISPRVNATNFSSPSEQIATLASLEKLGFASTSKQQTNKLEVDGKEATTSTKLSSLGVVGEGTLKINVGNEEKEIKFTEADTLKSLLNKISNETGLSASLTEGKITLSSSTNKSISITQSDLPSTFGFNEQDIGISLKQKSEPIKIGDKAVTNSTKLSSLNINSDGVMNFKVNDTAYDIDYTPADTFETLLKKIQDKTGLKASLDSGSIVLESDSERLFTVENTPFNFTTGQTLGSYTGEVLYSTDTSQAASKLQGTNTVAELLKNNSTDTNKFTISAMTEDGTMKDTTIEYKNTDTIDAIVSKINSSGAGVTAIFNDGQLSISANNTGEREGNKSEVVLLANKNIGTSTDLFKALGVIKSDESNISTDGEVALAEDGRNAQLTVNGVTYKQQSNVFNVAGYTITANEDLGTYDSTGKLTTPASNAISVSSTTNADDIIQKLKDFVENYNNLIKDLNTKTTEKRNVDYSPLTDAQKAEMTTDDINKWEEKAKAGLLKGDTNINSALSSMRQVLSQYVGGSGESLYKIGITTSASYSDNGKLEINEDKLREALEKDPEVVGKIFAGDSATGSKGIVEQLRTAAKNAVSNIEVTSGKATSISEKSYSLGRTISDLSTKIDDWKDRLKDIEERYWNQFSAMEKAIEKANSQSSIFSA